MYHDLYRHDDSESGFAGAHTYKIQVDIFEEQVRTIASYCAKHPETEVIFTFDDGGVSFYTLVAPIIEKYGYKGIFFISTKYINTPGFMTSNQIKELAQRGHTIGSHSHTHPGNLTHLSTNATYQEWHISNEVLRNIGIDINTASIPNGYSNKDILKTAVQAGYHILYTSTPTTKLKKVGSMTLVGRYAVTRTTKTYDVLSIISSDRQRWLLHIRWLILESIKMILGNQYETLRGKVLKFSH